MSGKRPKELHVYLSEDEYDWLKKHADETCRSLSAQMRWLIKLHMDREQASQLRSRST